MFTFFGQFFDHGLDLVTKGGGTVLMPLQPDDPLFVPGSPDNFMAMTRGQNLPGPDGILGTADDVQESMNTTTPWVDQNQTYTSHPSHQVFLRQYAKNARASRSQTGKMLDGDHCAPRPTGIAGDNICNIGNWGDVKRQASTILGIRLVDQDVFDVPLHPHRPVRALQAGPERLPAAGAAERPAGREPRGQRRPRRDHSRPTRCTPATRSSTTSRTTPCRTPASCRTPTRRSATSATPPCQPPGTYDDELLNAHFITGDGRGNENIALSMVHQIFHAEHNRLVVDIDRADQRGADAAGDRRLAAPCTPAAGWDYDERLFQAARFGTEMQYQHLVFEEFARKMQPLINPFLGGLTSINGGDLGGVRAHRLPPRPLDAAGSRQPHQRRRLQQRLARSSTCS